MDTGDRLHFIGTATTVVTLGSFTLLTDPNFLHRGQRAYLGWGLSTRRLTEPAITPEQVPELDAVLLSHLHGDHFDRVSRDRLDRSAPVLSTPHAVRRLDSWGFATHALRTWQEHSLDGPMGVDFVARCAPSVVVPVHHDDYTVFRSPLSDFVERFAASGTPAVLRSPRRGDVVSLEPPA